jgi:hypothetical protein
MVRITIISGISCPENGVFGIKKLILLNINVNKTTRTTLSISCHVVSYSTKPLRKYCLRCHVTRKINKLSISIINRYRKEYGSASYAAPFDVILVIT